MYLMKSNLSPSRNSFLNRPRRIKGSARVTLLVLLAFALGLGGGAFLFYGRSSKTITAALPGNGSGELSPATLSILSGLKGQVDVHYYAILDPNSTSETEKDFASRIDQLLAQYQAAADGKLKITRYDSSSDMGPQSAAKDGIAPFNLNKGDACYLGIAVLASDQKETFARLSPDWESALESDLSRAIAQVSNPKATTAANASAATGPSQVVINEVKAALPDLASTSAEQGAQVLREAAMKAVQTSIQDMSTQLQDAQKRLADSRVNGSAAEQQEALKEFQRLQSEQAKRIQDITGHLQVQLEALNKLKAQ
jgi:hypothetical protein